MLLKVAVAVPEVNLYLNTGYHVERSHNLAIEHEVNCNMELPQVHCAIQEFSEISVICITILPISRH